MRRRIHPVGIGPIAGATTATLPLVFPAEEPDVVVVLTDQPTAVQVAGAAIHVMGVAAVTVGCRTVFLNA